MQFSKHQDLTGNGAKPLDHIGFDMLRAMIAARQAATATCRAAASIDSESTATADDDGVASWFTGGSARADHHANHGRFSPLNIVSPSVIPFTDGGHRFGDKPCNGEGQPHV
jgi:hypothetical protein